MENDQDYAAILIQRLDEAAARNELTYDHNNSALVKLDKVIPLISKSSEGDSIVMAALREIYSVLEEGAEEMQSTISELKEARNSLEVSTNLLKQAGYDIANIQTFNKEKVWFAHHYPTVKLTVAIVDLPLLERALVESEDGRFKDIDNTVKRSRKKRAQAGKLANSGA